MNAHHAVIINTMEGTHNELELIAYYLKKQVDPDEKD
jgi:hypothetical protein